MPGLVFIGDELTATGYRLAGARVFIVPPEDTAEALAAAREDAAVVLLAASHARALPVAMLDAVLLATRPLALVVDDILARDSPPDIEDLVRRALGVEAA